VNKGGTTRLLSVSVGALCEYQLLLVSDVQTINPMITGDIYPALLNGSEMIGLFPTGLLTSTSRTVVVDCILVAILSS
jgi:hypothetical protein